MSIRVILCFIFVIGFSCYAYRNWFVSLCAAILLMAVLEHPDMPKGIGGIQGLNPWNFLMLNVLIAWFKNRQLEGLIWDLPGYITSFGVLYSSIIVVGFARLIFDHQLLDSPGLEGYNSFSWALSEYIVNCVKWVLPGLLLYDACRTRSRMTIALVCILLVYFLLALQVIKHMPLGAVAQSGNELSRIANKILLKSVGFHRVNLSMMFSGASWAVLTTLVLVRGRRNQVLILLAAGLISLGQALTGGRAGYVTWGLLGAIICLIRWRSLLPVIPLTILAVCTLLPGVRDRMLQGFVTGNSGPIVSNNDDYEITSGRNIAWGYVIPKIHESPIFGYGRQAMIRTGIYHEIMYEYDDGESFPHPHNAYLELLLDNGLIGFIIVIPFYGVIIWQAVRVLLDRSDPLFAAIGGTTFALVMALLIAAMGSQTFYPREGSVGMWAAIGLLLRLCVERSRSLASGNPLFNEDEKSSDSLEVPSEPVPA